MPSVTFEVKFRRMLGEFKHISRSVQHISLGKSLVLTRLAVI